MIRYSPYSDVVTSRRGYTDAEVAALIADGYTAVSTAAGLSAVRNNVGGKYIQTADIDLYAATRIGGTYYNGGAGWAPIDQVVGFTGIYDGGGYVINGLYLNRSGSYLGLFGIIKNGGIVKNIACINAEVITSGTGNYIGVLVGDAIGTVSTISKCVVHGTLTNSSTGQYIGGIFGGRHLATNHHVIIQDCISLVTIDSTGEDIGGIAGQVSESESSINNCYCLGSIKGEGTVKGCILGYAEGGASVSSCYFNKEISLIKSSIGFQSTNFGLKKASQMFDVSPSSTIYVGWDTNTWNFQKNRYPILKMIGESICTMTPPLNFATFINGDDDIEFSWDAPIDVPKGYNIYSSIDGVITKINITLITDVSYVYESASPASYEFFIRAVYDFRGFELETSGSPSIQMSYFLPILVKVSGNDVIIADARSSEDTDFQTIIGLPVAKEYEEIEASIALTDSSIIEGTAVGDWFGTGTIIYREFEDAVRLITQTITVEARRIVIENTITYKTSIQIDYEGFKFTGNTAFSKFQNIFASGSGQNIVTSVGMFFHNGNYTPHYVLADLNTTFAYKNYVENDTETLTVYLMDGRDFSPSRILFQPDGKNSSLVISNHADGQTINSLNALFYGTSDTGSIDHGSKGVALRGVLGDWSTYPNTPVGFEGNQVFIDLLTRIKALGNEIIPHSAYSNTSLDHRDKATIYYPMFQSLFQPKNWTDHSLGGGLVSAGICGKGWDITDATNYILDLFEQYGFKKAWAYLDETNKMLLGKGLWSFEHDSAYVNDHLVLPISGDRVILWRTCNRPFYGRWGDIDDLVDENDVLSAHEYLANATAVGGEDTLDIEPTIYISGSETKITTGFDNLLQDIATKKAQGYIWNPTTTEWLDYVINLKNVIVSLTDSNTITIQNNSIAISGFSIIICKKNISPIMNGVAMSKKDAKNGTICWANLPIGESIIQY